MWNDELQVNTHNATFYTMLANVVHGAFGMEFELVCTYGDPYHHQTRTIQEQAANFVYDNVCKPTICMGGLNELLYDMGKWSTNVNYRRMFVFRALIKNCGFFDIGYSDLAYTWLNRHHTSNLV